VYIVHRPKSSLRAQMLVEQLWDSSQGVLSTQVLQKLCINLHHKVSDLGNRTTLRGDPSCEPTHWSRNPVVDIFHLKSPLSHPES
jgi:hypothetical protein